MNRDDIIRMAQEAGLWLFNDSEGHCDGITDVELITAEKDRDDDRLAEILMPFANLVAAAVTKKAIEACRVYLNEEEPYPGFQNGVECCIAAIENREEFLKHMRGRDEVS